MWHQVAGMRQGMWHPCRYPTETVEGKNGAGTPRTGELMERSTQTWKPLPRGVWGWAVFYTIQICNILLTLAVKLGGFVCQKQRGTTKHLGFSSYYIIQLSCTHEFHSKAGSLGRMLQWGPARLQPRRETMQNRPHQAREVGCQPGTVKTTLRLSPEVVLSFFHVSGCSDFWGFYGCSGNWVILCGGKNVTYKNPLQKSDN